MPVLQPQSFLVLRSSLRAVGMQWLLIGRACLFRTHIRLSGWSLRGRYHRHIELPDVAGVQWYFGRKPSIALKLHTGETLVLRVGAAALWRLHIETLLRGSQVVMHPDAPPASRHPYRHQVLYAGPVGGDGLALSAAALRTRHT